jgi:tetratricopeptide (TPR) repeat protein
MDSKIADRLKKLSSPLYRRLRNDLEHQLRIHPRYADLYNQLGLVLAHSGERAEAEQHFRKAIRLNPNYREAFLNLAYLYLEGKQWNKAKVILVPESRRGPRDGSLHHVLAICYLNVGKEKEASIHLGKAACHPYYAGFYRKMGIWKKEKVSLTDKARQVFMNLSINNHDAHFHNFVGFYLAKEGKAAQALRELERAAQLKPDDFLFHANIGAVYYHQGVYEKALREYKKAIRMEPRNGMGYAYLSYVYGLIRRPRQALRSMEKAVRLCPRYADLRYNLALLYGDRGRYKEAVAELRKALRINPNYLFAQINLGVLYEDMGRWKEAARTYEKILQITPEDDHIRHRLQGVLRRERNSG